MSEQIANLLPLLLIFIIFYFFLIRPQQKKIKDHKLMVTSLKRGDEIITSGGIIGTIEKVHDDDKIDIKISDSVIVKVVKSTVQGFSFNPNIKK